MGGPGDFKKVSGPFCALAMSFGFDIVKNMKQEHPKIALISPIVNGEVKNLLEMFEFYLTERQLQKSIDVLSDAVHDLRIIVQRLLIDHFLKLSAADEGRFCSTLATLLAERSTRIPSANMDDKKYFDYVIGEILTCFEWAQEIKSEFPEDLDTQRILSFDIPLLRPFDYGIRVKIRMVRPPKTRQRKK